MYRIYIKQYHALGPLYCCIVLYCIVFTILLSINNNIFLNQFYETFIEMIKYFYTNLYIIYNIIIYNE